MKVVILCGGKGTRLREETEFRPKPMVPIGGRPILWHIMKIYAHYGHRDFVLCLGYKGEMIKEYFRNYLWNTCDVTLTLGRTPEIELHDRHSEEDWRVTLADTGEESMTAYRIKAIQRYIPQGESFMLTYGDGLGPIDLDALVANHKASGKICTLSAVHPAGRFGALRIDDDGSIHAFHEKPQFEDAHVNGGYMVCGHEMFDYLNDDPTVMFERGPMDALVRDRQLNAFRHDGFWQPMDTYAETQHLNQLWIDGRAPWKLW
jgi:glucose-1-phosphate cytidylyltransferase